MTKGTLGLRVAVAAFVLAALLLVLHALRGVLSPVVFAFLLAYLLDPLVDWFEARRVPRALGVVVLLSGALLALALLALLVVPAIARDMQALAAQLPRALQRALDGAEPMLRELGVPLPTDRAQLVEQLEQHARALSLAELGSLQSVVTSFVGGTASALSGALALLIVPVLAFYLLVDFDRLVGSMLELVPPRYRELVVERVAEVDFVLGQFVRGQLLVMLLLAVAYAVGFGMVGVPLAVPIGIVAGGLSFIPYVGGAIALALALVMSALHGSSLALLTAVVIVYSVVQLLEGFVITPRIVGEKLGLSPLAVLFALMAGGELFGFLGVMAALPVAAVLKVLLLRGLLRYRASALYGEPSSAVTQAPLHEPLVVRRSRPIRFRAPYPARARASLRAKARRVSP